MKHTDVRNIRKEVLPNGLTVITEAMDHVRSVVRRHLDQELASASIPQGTLVKIAVTVD